MKTRGDNLWLAAKVLPQVLRCFMNHGKVHCAAHSDLFCRKSSKNRYLWQISWVNVKTLRKIFSNYVCFSKSQNFNKITLNQKNQQIMHERLKKSDIFWTRFCHFCHISLQSTSTVSRNGPSNRVERRNPRFGWTKSYIIFLVFPNLLWPFSIHLHLFSSHPLMYILTKVYKKKKPFPHI